MAALPPNEPPTPENEPEWLRRWKLQAAGALPPTQPADTQRTPTGRWQVGTSGNPAGNTYGKTKAQRLREQFDNNADGVVQVVIDAALKGSLDACALVLQRLVPSLRNAREKVTFTLDTKLPIGDQARQVVQAVADGHISSDDARLILGCLSTMVAIAQADEIEERLAKLEAANTVRQARGGIVEMENLHEPNS